MGKGFQNFMSKKDFHPSAWWNLKKVWEAREVKSQKEKREEEMRVQYEKEQEMLNNKALLGDEKAKMGLSFMYDAPAGMAKREEPTEEPKFEWQRKYQAPREEWAKNNELIQDQPFGIQVKNVRCCRCHKWGHINTDNECPLYGMSGNFEDAGYANNPSDLIKEYRKEKSNHGPSSAKRDRLDDEEWVDKEQLAEDMKESYSLRLKGHVLNGIREDQQLAALKGPTSEAEEKIKFLASLSDKQKKKMLKKLLGGAASEKKSKKDKKKEKKAKKAAKLLKVKKEVESESSDSEGEPSVKRGRHESVSDDKKSGRHRHSERDLNDHEQNKRRRHDSDSSIEVTSRRSPTPDKERRTHKSHDTSGYDARKVKVEPESESSDIESKNVASSSSRKRSSDHDASKRGTERDRKERRVSRERSEQEHGERRGSRERQSAKIRDDEKRRSRHESSGDRNDRRRSRSPRDDRRRQRRSRSRS